MLLRKFFSAEADQHHMFTLFQHRTRQQNRVFDMFDRGDRSGLQRRPVHDDRIELDVAVEVQVRAVSRVKRRSIL